MTKNTHNKEILEGIPRGVWSDLWAQEQEEKGRSFSGQDISDAAPNTPGWAKKWGKKIADRIVEMNGKSLEDLYELVEGHGFPHGRRDFGFLLGMQSVGHGVSWSDDTRGLPHETIKLPYTEFNR